MAHFNLQQQPHRRFNPLTREWVLVSPHRTQRPWLGQTDAVSKTRLSYDPACYMCPGNARAGGVHNSNYEGVYVFDNDFPALLADTPEGTYERGELLIAKSEAGICRVMCFSPRHDLTLSRMNLSDIEQVVNTWSEEYARLSALPLIHHVQIFENRGAMMGASNPHPHCQIWANATVPTTPLTEQASFEEYRLAHHTCLLCDYVRLELDCKERIVCENDHFLVMVPFWAVWPFETLVASKRHLVNMTLLEHSERTALADILKRLTTRYDNLFETSFPYSMGFHQRSGDGEHPESHFHAHFLPPLLRSATVRKFSVGYEMLAMPQRDITAETAAERLRSLTEQHYLEKS
jgi:UDPglucose--hexose-1-phosphate uridylyltransferase